MTRHFNTLGLKGRVAVQEGATKNRIQTKRIRFSLENQNWTKKFKQFQDVDFGGVYKKLEGMEAGIKADGRSSKY